MEEATDKEAMRDRIAGALVGSLIGDALSMPAHWFYDVNKLRSAYGGPITGYRSACDVHSDSLLRVSNTGGHGRGSAEGSIVGGVILHDAKQYWGPGGVGVHYHRGMKAGDNTLNSLCSRVVTRSITRSCGRYDGEAFLTDYVAFMTTPGTHGDTYCESYHRDFFCNWSQGVPPDQCAGAEGHNTASSGGLVTLAPVVCSQFGSQRDEAIATTLKHLRFTHTSPKLERYASQYAGLLWDLIHGQTDLKAGCVAAANTLDVTPELSSLWSEQDTTVIGRVFSPACYIDGSFPACLYVASKYAHDAKAGLLANVNVGGETCHRGAAIGALFGAALGLTALPQDLVTGLSQWEQIKVEVEAFVDTVAPLATAEG